MATMAVLASWHASMNAGDGIELAAPWTDPGHVAGARRWIRPERIAGLVPTEEFLTGGADGGRPGFTPADPPNAALVLPGDRILIVELIEPTHDVTTGQARFQLRVLDDVPEVDLQLESEPLRARDVVGEFAAASLFIDDCPDGQVICSDADGVSVGTTPDSGNMGFCWNFACCEPCEATGDADRSPVCNETFFDRKGACSYRLSAAFTC